MILAGRRDAHAAAAIPHLDAPLVNVVTRLARDQMASATVLQVYDADAEPQRITHAREHAVGPDTQIRLGAETMLELEPTVGIGTQHQRIGHDLDAALDRPVRQN